MINQTANSGLNTGAAAAFSPVVMSFGINNQTQPAAAGKTTARVFFLGKKSANLSVAGAQPATVQALPQPKTFAEKMRDEAGQRRFTVEDLCRALERQLVCQIVVISDQRGLHPGGVVRLKISDTPGGELAIRTLPVETAPDGAGRVEYFVWEITGDLMGDLRPRAGKGTQDLVACAKRIRQMIAGY